MLLSLLCICECPVLQVEQAIYMVMGANIGTSVTNTIVAVGQIKERDKFQLAFAGATVHDMFNILTAIVLLPVEAASEYLHHLSSAIVQSYHLDGADKDKKQDLLKAITKSLTSRVVQIDKKPLELIAEGKLDARDAKLLKQSCSTVTRMLPNCTVSTTAMTNTTTPSSSPTTLPALTPASLNSSYAHVAWNTSTNTTAVSTNGSIEACVVTENVPCDYLFHGSTLPESAIGAILLVWSLVMLCVTLVLMVKILTRLLKGQLSESAKKMVNADFPGRFAFLTGYVAILVGAGFTMLVQSSSVFTSSLTPLVGLGIIELERMYPLTLGANIGTTITGILAALASSKVVLALEVSLYQCKGHTVNFIVSA